jgi:hypothetical protein
MLDEGIDFPQQILDTGKRPAANGALGDETEPAFHLIEPRRISRSVVYVIAGPLRQPGAYLKVFVSGVVVDDQMQVELGGHGLIQAA